VKPARELAVLTEPVLHLRARVAWREPHRDVERGASRRVERTGRHDAIESERVALADFGGEPGLHRPETGCVEEHG
jgi:hypothetical protein